MFKVEITDEFGGTLAIRQHRSRAQAISDAKAAAKHEQGSATICDEDHTIIYEFKYEDGEVLGYDDEGNQVFNV